MASQTPHEPVFVVARSEDSRWCVTCDRKRDFAAFSSRRDAIQYVHACAQQARPSVVRVLAADGALEDVWFYGAVKGIRRVDPSAGVAP